MKLIKEFLLQEIILLLIALIVMEIFILYWLTKRPVIIYEETYTETMDRIENKTLEDTKKFEEFIKNYIAKYLADLKIIALHSILFNINKTDETNNLDNKDKEIYQATLENLNEKGFGKFQNEEGNLYINSYEKEFENISDTNFILNSLFNNTQHPELNSIGYYSINNDELSKDEENNIKNMISIFKSIFIKRYIIKRNFLDYICFYIFNKEKMFIYPPIAYNLTHSSFFDRLNVNNKCNNTNNPFPLCYYNYMDDTFYSQISNIPPNKVNFITILKEKMNLQNNFGSVCVRMRYMKNQEEPAIVCIEINFSKLFRPSFINTEKYDLGMFTRENGLLFPVINIDQNIYDIILNQFHNESIENHGLYRIGNCRLFTFYHFLYYNLTQSAKKGEVEVNWNEINIEYNEIISLINNKVKELLDLKNGDKYITFDFNKTISQKKLLERGYEIVKDTFKMIIIPVSFNIRLLDENYLETDFSIRKNIDMYIYAIISTNPKINEEKILTIIRLKRIRLILFYSLMSFIVLCFYALAINLISQHSLYPIYDIQNQLKKLEITMNKKNFMLEEDKINSPNKEIAELKEIFEFMRKIQIIKNAFEKENYLKKHDVEFYNLI